MFISDVGLQVSVAIGLSPGPLSIESCVTEWVSGSISLGWVSGSISLGWVSGSISLGWVSGSISLGFSKLSNWHAILAL